MCSCRVCCESPIHNVEVYGGCRAAGSEPGDLAPKVSTERQSGQMRSHESREGDSHESREGDWREFRFRLRRKCGVSLSSVKILCGIV